MNASSPHHSVLVVDDDPLVLRIVGRWLKRRGYAARTADSGAEARRLVDEEQPALVITDLHLPGGDGLALVEDLDQTKTIVMSGDIDALPPRCLRDNLVAIGKPFAPETLEELVAELLPLPVAVPA